MKRRISIIMPAFNVRDYIREALQSIFTQDTPGFDFEIIVIDDGSDDGTADIVKSYGSAVEYLSLPRCGRVGAVRNHGLRRATGEYVAFLDADDFWLESSLQRRLAVLEEQPKVGLVHGNYYTLTAGVRTLQFDGTLPPSGRVFDDLFRRNFIYTSSVLVRRTLLEKAGGFHPHVRSAEDYWLWLQLAARSEVQFVLEPVLVYRLLRPGSLSESALTDRLADLMRVVSEIGRDLGVPANAVDERVNRLRIWLTKEQVRQGRYARASAHFLRALWTQPLPTLREGVRSIRKRGLRRPR